jgi:flavin-dependent thymidylate synthase
MQISIVDTMKISLAGYNIDSVVIDELKKNNPPREDVTPETLSASYARISRDPRPAEELRAAARAEVARARRSNQNIIFKMGHHSVAEHAVFNFDIVGVSRLALEEIEKFRLCSYTEKSQRYTKLKDDFVIPVEIKGAGLEKIFVKIIKAQNALYHQLFARLKPFMFDKFPDMAGDPKKHSILNGWAMEDARYIVSLATLGQLGLTLNARNLEFLIRRFSSKKLAELKELNQKIYELAKDVAPSIILFTGANDFDALTYPKLEKKTEKILDPGEKTDVEKVSLVGCSENGDEKLAAALIHTSTSLPYEACLKRAQRLDPKNKESLIKSAMQYMEFYDSPLREFEYVDFTFDLVVSATCFAQLKRHRMATLTVQAYDPCLGVTIPPSVEAVGGKDEFLSLISRTDEVYALLKEKADHGAEYVLTNAHRKRVLFKVNARELYHISRLREDQTAQWDIRQIVERMTEMAKEKMPLTCLLLGGKDGYPKIYEKVFGKPPKAFPPNV